MNSPAQSGSATPAEVPAKGAWGALVVLFLIYSCHYLDRSVIGVLVEPIKREFSLSDGQMGLLTGLAYGVAFCIAGVPLGLLADRVSRKRLLAVLLVAWSGLTALSGLAQSYGQLLLARMAVGAAESGGSPTAMSMIADLFPASRRGTATALFFLSTAAGMALSHGLGGLIAAAYGWRTAFLLAGVPGVVLAVLLMWLVKEPRRGQFDAPTAAAGGFRRALAHLLTHRGLLALVLALVVMAFCASARAAFVVPLLMRSHDLSVAQAGGLVALGAAVFGALGALSGGLLADRLGRTRPNGPFWLLVFAALSTGAFELGFTLAADLGLAVGMLLASHYLGSLYLGPGYALVSSASPTPMRGAIIAMLQVGANLVGYGLGPLAAGLLSDAYAGPHSLRWSLATLCVAYLLAAGLFAMAAIRAPARNPAT